MCRQDSVEQYDPFAGSGTGWKFDRYCVYA
jgi:hypothetical protein